MTVLRAVQFIVWQLSMTTKQLPLKVVKMDRLAMIIGFLIGDVTIQLLGIVLLLRGANADERVDILDAIDGLPFIFWPWTVKLVRHWNEE